MEKSKSTLTYTQRLEILVKQYQENPNEENFELVYKYVGNLIQSVISSLVHDKQKFILYREELYQQAVIGIHKALKRNFDNGGYFYYLRGYIQNEVVSFLKKRRKIATHEIEDVGIPIQDCSTINAIENHQMHQIADLFNQWMRQNLKWKDYMIFKDRYLDGKHLNEIGNKYGVTKQAISQRFQKKINPVIEKSKNLIPIWSM